MLTTIIIKELTVFTYIGVYDWEKTIKQKLLINLEISYNSNKAMQSDDVSHCLDYAKLCNFIIKFAENSRFQLLETLAHKLLEELKNNFAIDKFVLEITKPQAIAQAKNVGIRITNN